jgi:hypothetical protein
MNVRDPNINTAASKRSRGARQTSRGREEQHQGDTATYDDVTQGHWRDDLEAQSLDEAETRESGMDDEG